MDETRLPRKILVANIRNDIGEKSVRGRPKNSWIQTIKGDLLTRGLQLSKITEIELLAADRVNWRTKVVYNGMGRNHITNEHEQELPQNHLKGEAIKLLKDILTKDDPLEDLNSINSITITVDNKVQETEEYEQYKLKCERIKLIEEILHKKKTM
jgi:hypothetical protein